MNYFERTRLYLFIIIILVIFNISAIVAIIYHLHSEHRQMRPDREDARDRGRHLADKIGFDKVQAVQFDTLRADFGRKAKIIMNSIQEKKLEMLNEFTSENPDTAKLYKITHEIGNLHADMRRLSIDHFMSIKKICTPDQKAKLLDLFRNIMKMEEGPGFNRQFRHGNPMDKKPFVPEGLFF
jgi:Spy/CpxP family protein refolding chaperone